MILLNSNKNIPTEARSLYRSAVSSIAKVVGFFAPGRAAQYLYQHNILRAYDGATTQGPDGGWLPTNNTGDQEIKRDFSTTLARARDLDRNHPFVTDALRIGYAYTVGNALVPQSQIFKPKSNKRDLEKIRLVEATHAVWAEHCCLDGRDMVDLNRFIYRHLKIDGEFFCIISSDKTHPLKLQPIEPDQIDSNVDGPLKNGNYAIRGLEFEKTGKCVAYHIYDAHPGGFELSRKTARIPAERMIHVYQPGRITETRGICHFVSSILPLFDQNELSDSILDLHRIAAAYGIFIESEFPQDAISGFGSRQISKDGKTSNEKIRTITPAGVHYTNVGEKVKTTKPEMPTANFLGFDQGYQRKGGKGFGLSYETFTGDLSNANFSTLKAGQNNERCLFRVESSLIIRKAKLPIWRLWMDASHLIGNLQLPNYWQKKALYQKVRFSLPALPSPDPWKEEKADTAALKNKSTSRHRINERKGQDYDEVMQELAEEEVYIAENFPAVEATTIDIVKLKTEIKDELIEELQMEHE